MLNKRVDAVVNSRSTMMVVMRDAPGKFQMIGGVSDITAYFGMAFRKEDGELRDFVNTQLAAMKTDGTLTKLQETWFGGPSEFRIRCRPCCPANRTDMGGFDWGAV